jgi:DNA-binding MarR family transcriptional regulator
VTHSATSETIAEDLERIVIASVAVTARALADVSPELTLVQWRVLVLVDQHGGMGIGPIAAALGTKIAAVSRLIGRLRARGLVETRRGESDARLVLVSLTPKGEELRARVVERRRAELSVALAQLLLQDQAARTVDLLADALERLT